MYVCKLPACLHFLPRSCTKPSHYQLQGTSDPEKVFDRTSNLENTQIINYRADAQEKWCVLVGIAPGAPERYALAAEANFM